MRWPKFYSRLTVVVASSSRPVILRSCVEVEGGGGAIVSAVG